MTKNDFDAQELILRFEQTRDPFKYLVDGICIWPIFRFAVWENLKANRENITKRQTILQVGRLERIRAYGNVIRELPRAWKLVFAKKKHEIVVITTTNRLRDKVNGEYRNIYFDYFERGLENALFIYADSKGSAEPIKKSSIYLSNKAALPAIAWRSIFGPKQIDKIRTLYDELKTFLNENECGEFLDIPFAEWKRTYVIYLSKRDLLARLFGALDTKLFIVDCSYGKEWAVAAAKQSGVPAWELQHGVPDGNIAYFYRAETIEKYKKHLPVPDQILTFGEYFSERFAKGNIWAPGQMTSIGLARLEHHQRDFQYAAPPPGENVRVLVTSQWTVADRIAEYLEKAVEQLPQNITLSIKPHPSEENMGTYRSLGNKVTILDKHEEYYHLLTQYHIHCSVYSTTILESLGMGVPTVILGLPGSENVIPVTDRGYCKVASTPEDFISIMKDSARGDDYLVEWHKSTCKNRSFFWEPQPSENLQRAITDLVED
jgi:hypothetical protein